MSARADTIQRKGRGVEVGVHKEMTIREDEGTAIGSEMVEIGNVMKREIEIGMMTEIEIVVPEVVVVIEAMIITGPEDSVNDTSQYLTFRTTQFYGGWSGLPLIIIVCHLLERGSLNTNTPYPNK